MKKAFLFAVSISCCTFVFAQNFKSQGDAKAAAGDYAGAAAMYEICMQDDDGCAIKYFKLIYEKKIEAEYADQLYQIIFPLAQKGSAEAQYYIASMYDQGYGVVKDQNKAMEWHTKAAGQGYEESIKYVDKIKEEERLMAELKAKEEEERLMAEKKAKEEEERLMAERKAKEEEERLMAERKAKEEEERLMAEQKAKEEEERLMAEKKAKEEQERLMAEQKAKEEEVRLAAEKKAKEIEDRRIAEQKAKEQEKKKAPATVNKTTPPVSNTKSGIKFSFGIKTGLNFANINGADFTSSMKTGFHIGALANIRFGYRGPSAPGMVALQPELLYSQQGFKVNEDACNFSYFTLPILLKIYVFNGLNIHAGPYFSYLLGVSPESININGPTVVLSDLKGGSDAGICLGAGFDTKMGLTIGARYALGFSDLAGNFAGKNRVVSVSVGWMF